MQSIPPAAGEGGRVSEVAHLTERREWLRSAFAAHEREPETPFAELVLAHYLRQAEVYRNRSYGGTQETAYQEKLRAFTRSHGRIVDVYWCSRAPSAVAVTERSRRSLRTLGLVQRYVVYHAETDWIAGTSPAISDQIHACSAVAVKVGEVLRGTSELIALQWLVTAVERLLAIVDQAEAPLDEKLVKQSVAANQNELRAIQRYYEKSAESQARLVYFHGMMRGAALLVALVGAVLAVLWATKFGRWHSPVTQDILIAVGFGGVGAIISVLSRMAGKGAFAIDHEVGRKMVRRLGSVRPFIGATFAIAIYFGLRSKLFTFTTVQQSAFFFAAVSFLAGFSERWAKVVLGTVTDPPPRSKS
jgi:hypothetical protein